MGLRVGIDLGGTNIRVGLINDLGEIHIQLHDVTDPYNYESTLSKLVQMVSRVTEGIAIDGIGIGAPGPMDSIRGVILSPLHLPGWEQVYIVERMKEHFNTVVKLNNDANVAALAEARFGSGKGYESVYFITVSTGIGGGFVLNGRLLNGAQGYAGEIGNMIINPAGVKKVNQNKGSLESYVSGTSISRIATEKFGVAISTKEVFILADEGDQVAQTIIDEVIMYLAMGVANLVHTLNPEIFIMGGGVMQNERLMLVPLKEKVKEYLYPALADNLLIVPAALGGNSGVVGAAMLV
jgi:glucokinase